MMWWALWCVAVVVGSSVVAATPASDSLNMDMVQIDPSAPDDESMYAVQPMAGRYASAPWLYLLSDIPHDAQVPKVTTELNEGRSSDKEPSIYEETFAKKERRNRERRSFTVNPPVDHLHKIAYLYYMGRVAQENRDILNRIGKRARWSGPEEY